MRYARRCRGLTSVEYIMLITAIVLPLVALMPRAYKMVQTYFHRNEAAVSAPVP